MTAFLRQALCVLSLLAAGPALAAWPDKPVRIVVPNTPGGPVDVTMRLLATELSRKWGQPVIIENKAGASGMITGAAVASSPPDGYVLGTMLAATMTIVPFAVDRMPYDPRKDLAPVTTVARTPFIFLVPKDSPFKTWKDFVDAARQRELKLGSYSIGTGFHVGWERIARQAGIKVLYAPSSSAAKTQGDLLGGILDISFDAPSSAKGLIDSGRLRPLAITSAQRFSGLPDVPTLDESGLKGFSTEPWFSLMARAGTPDDVIAKIQRDVAAVLATPAMHRQMEMLGQVPVADTPAELAETVRKDRAAMEPLVKELGIRLQ
ncbi:tripartite tricarboxylate transporter substrate binding protein [Pigmentiphaga sp. GD03639]|uniref:Tripartite tricarboxylate transporter substrate binding protein n=1 Tax=Pigmentiphaga daeguensis TaxID=414049 RepID=A0ABN1CWV4_9BURK|nr:MULTISPECIES: tripartite tricarboxylate transporter substrate binding protein [unclassified Pigmentiphaga]MDH2236002.1 tripartite tricarboxylate transporter substrate binding protein [Pigmentiphaga sp. GD03639]OVZ62079.1 ABC transporter substrate-binding protein [Pigmentiphaga sp. NML030171]